MLIESVAMPVRYTWPNGEIRLEPGKPVNVMDEQRALKVLAKCGSKVRVIEPDWLGAWRELAKMTVGIEKEHPRFQTILDALEECDQCFEQGDWPQLQQMAEKMNALCRDKSNQP